MLDLEDMKEVGEGGGEERREVSELLEPKIDTTINLPNKQEGKGKCFVDGCWLLSGIRWFLFGLAFVFAMKNHTML